MNLFQAIFNRDSLGGNAILFEQQQITYAELGERTLAIAAALHDLAIKPGDRVALLLNDSPEFVAVFIAVCSYGAIAVPINMALRLDEQRAILNDCTASVAFVEAELCKTLLGETSSNLPQLEQVVVVNREFSAKGFQEHREASNAALKIWSFEDLVTDAKHDNRTGLLNGEADNQPAFILYTSGSTGEPKGAIHR